METKNKTEYINSWVSHINTCYALAMTPDAKLSKEVSKVIEELKSLVTDVANDKWKAQAERRKSAVALDVEGLQ